MLKLNSHLVLHRQLFTALSVEELLQKKSKNGYELNSCKHLTFIFVGESDVRETSEFTYMSEDLKKRSEGNTAEGIDNFKEFLAKAGYGNELLALEITYSGMACGPVSFTDVYGFDFNTIEEDD